MRWHPARTELTILGSAVLAATGLTFVLLPLGAATAAPSAESDRPSERQGERIWQQDCAVCHAPDATGSFQGPDISRSGTAAVDFMVRTGRMPVPMVRQVAGGDVPAQPAQVRRGPVRYSEAEIRSLVAYAARLVTGPAAPRAPAPGSTDIARGGDLYRLDCAACHQMAGSGGALAYGTDVPALGRSTPVEVIEAMRVGPGSMPVFSEASLDADDAADIAAYVQYLHHPEDRGGAALWHLGPVPEGLVAWIVGVGGVILLCRWLGERDRVRTH